MKRSILAARTQAAIDRIGIETARLGGEFSPPGGRMPDAEHRQLALLEAFAAALTGIELPQAVEPTDSVTESLPSEPKAGRTVRKKGL